MSAISVIKANLFDGDHQSAVVAMLDAYSSDPMGDDRPLSEFARTNLIRGLQEHPTTLIFLAYDGESPCGIVTCFRGFSTFAALPLYNISDYFVVPGYRGRGIGRLLFEAVLAEAKASGCCKLTLEVQENNQRARAIYQAFGFKQAVYAADVAGGGSLYMTKPL